MLVHCAGTHVHCHSQLMTQTYIVSVDLTNTGLALLTPINILFKHELKNTECQKIL